MGKYWGIFLFLTAFSFAEISVQPKKKKAPPVKKEFSDNIVSEEQDDSKKGAKPPDAGYIFGKQPPPQGGGDAKAKSKDDIIAVNTEYWIPICFMADPTMTNEQIQNGVKGVADGFGKCDIAVEPFIFRVTKIDDNPEIQNKMAQTACDANKTFGVAGSAVQSLSPSWHFSDDMCKEPPNPPNKEYGKVAGCSVLGNGAAGGNSKAFDKAYDKFGAGSFGGKGQKGVPADSAVDVEAWSSPPVWCHELGHSVGGPGLGGDYLVNEGEGRGPLGGIGLQKIKHDEESSLNIFSASEGGGAGKNCDFTEFGCASLRGGSNKNDGKHRWYKNKPAKGYYYHDPKSKPYWNLYENKSFFKTQKKGGGAGEASLSKSVATQGSAVDENVQEKVIAEETKAKSPETKQVDSEHRKSSNSKPIEVTIKSGEQKIDSIGAPPAISGKSKAGEGSTVDENAPPSGSNNSTSSEGKSGPINTKSQGSQGSGVNESSQSYGTSETTTYKNSRDESSEEDDEFF
jgi:hypothetical protein